MKSRSARIQPDLFEQAGPSILSLPGQRERLAALVEAMLIEIAASLAVGEVNDDQDHG
jgi:hypothetical protein